MKTLAVYCGAAHGANPFYADAARALARAMVEHNIALVYGGGKVGLMGVIADEVLRLGGEATGVIPRALVEREVGHAGLTRLFVVKDMHERKTMMSGLSEGFIAMPGGMGTLEELFEMVTWAQLGIHAKPIGLLNVNGFYDGLRAFVRHQVQEGFVRPEHEGLMVAESDPDELIRRLRAAAPAPAVQAAVEADAEARGLRG
ncbi:TIGR00730 family Rossman fold protein [Massilia timonae]|uniref:Cytokinin riboside 5'-monophosphate phosphoribohydrolase n=1 Tax=Massilia timonae CCUG 45783 TaxID=883126 RepID=K9DNZ1_9BURK|nr:TIGR00730 family Rossman fold protein [Massilia timonae]EKU80502.1 TIGR00730 family protein [Massilia timonae CCUG 45783]